MIRRLARGLLLVYAFAVPWEYSLDLGEPFGNIARIVGLLLLLVAIPAVLESGGMRRPGPLQWAVLAFYLYFCCTAFWTIDSLATFEKIRAYFQTMMSVWLLWELAESPADLRNLLRAVVAGSWVLAILTVLNFATPEANAAEQIRFVAEGQDPNDVARFLDMAFPFAALLFRLERNGERGRESEKHRSFINVFSLLGLGYLPLGLFAVLLTASRGGFASAMVAFLGSLFILAAGRGKRLMQLVFAVSSLLALMWFALPEGVLNRLSTLPIELTSGDLNARLNIWSAGWQAFRLAPWFGSGAGAFVAAAHLAPEDTAHNTPLTLLVTGGLCALMLAAFILCIVIRDALRTKGLVRIALVTALLALTLSSLVGTIEENRLTWLLFALISFAGSIRTDPATEPNDSPVSCSDPQPYPAQNLAQ